MEQPGGHNRKLVVCIYEAIGTCFLLLGVNWGAAGYQAAIVSIVLAVNIIVIGPITGGHCNPAVTLGVLFAEGFDKFSKNVTFALMIITSQILGASIGCAISFFGAKKLEGDNNYTNNIAKLCPNSAFTSPATDCSPGDAAQHFFIVEMFADIVFVGLILNLKKHNGSKEWILNGAVIGLTLYGMINLAGPISGGCLNPAVGLVQSIFQHLLNDKLKLTSMWIYICGCSLGGIFAGLLQQLHNITMKEIKAEEDIAHAPPPIELSPVFGKRSKDRKERVRPWSKF